MTIPRPLMHFWNGSARRKTLRRPLLPPYGCPLARCSSKRLQFFGGIEYMA